MAKTSEAKTWKTLAGGLQNIPTTYETTLANDAIQVSQNRLPLLLPFTLPQCIMLQWLPFAPTGVYKVMKILAD